MFISRKVWFTLGLLTIVVGGGLGWIQSSKAEPTYLAYDIKVKYCPPSQLERFVGDTHDNGCTANAQPFKVWAVEGQQPLVKLYRTEHTDISWMASSTYVPVVYSKGCLNNYFPPNEPGYYSMDFPIVMQPQAAQDRQEITDNLEIEIIKEFRVSQSEMEETARLLGQQPIDYQPVPSGANSNDRECSKLS